MPRVAVVTFDCRSEALADDMPLGRQHLRERLPAVSVEKAVPQVHHLVVEPPERCRITSAQNPGESLPLTAVNGFDEPKFVFF